MIGPTDLLHPSPAPHLIVGTQITLLESDLMFQMKLIFTVCRLLHQHAWPSLSNPFLQVLYEDSNNITIYQEKGAAWKLMFWQRMGTRWGLLWTGWRTIGSQKMRENSWLCEWLWSYEGTLFYGIGVTDFLQLLSIWLHLLHCLQSSLFHSAEGIFSRSLLTQSLLTQTVVQTNLWHTSPKWYAKRFPWHAAFNAVPIVFIYFVQQVSLCCGIYVYIHISDSAQIVHELPFLSNKTSSETLLHKSGAVRSGDWLFTTGAAAWHLLDECVTLGKRYYSFLF